MRNQRKSGLALVACVLAALPLGAAEFNQRMAAWQSGGPAAPTEGTLPAPSGAATQAEMQVQPQAGASPRVLSESYQPRMTGPNYDTPSPFGWPAHGPDCSTYWDSAVNPYVSGAAGCGCGGGHGPLLSHAWNNCGHGCGGFCGGGGCNGCDSCGSCGGCGAGCNTLVWGRYEVLLWWRQGRDLPPLVTTDPVSESSTTAGILPDATILFGGGRIGTNMQAGGRLDIGTWTDQSQCFGIGDRFFGLGRDSSEFNITSLQNPVLAIPFHDFATDANNALLVAYPGLRTGEIHIGSTSSVLGNDVYGRFLVCRDCNGRLDFITGWNYTRVADNVEINSTSTVTEVGGNVPVGTVRDTHDRFAARNEFNGAIFGLMWEGQCGCWSTNLLARMSIGNMHEQVGITGSTRIAVPGQPVTTTNGGLFTADSNTGQFGRDEFTAITEAGLTIGYRIAPCTRFTVGYTFMYWSDLVSPGKSIDTSIGDDDTTVRPRFTFKHSDFWVQGVNLGLVREF